MPTVGEQRTEFLGTESQKRPFASAFSHEKEQAEPGYYSVFLDTYGVKAELTSTERAAMHRYTFPESREVHSEYMDIAYGKNTFNIYWELL